VRTNLRRCSHSNVNSRLEYVCSELAEHQPCRFAAANHVVTLMRMTMHEHVVLLAGSTCCTSVQFTWFPRLLEGPGIVFVKFPRPGKSWKSECEVPGSPGICSAMMRTADAVMRTQTPKYARPHASILCSNGFFGIPSRHVAVMIILQYGSCCHTG